MIFTKEERKIILIILAVIGIISFFNFRIALRRGRDNERENDLGDISKILESYHSQFNTYPMSLSDLKGNVPKDPLTSSGYSYLYLTDGKNFQIYAKLEGNSDESEYNANLEKRNLKCGNFICNFGRSNGKTPLDKTIEQYENELKANEKK